MVDRVLTRREERQIDYYLPIVLERIVMAVSSGLDLIAAITVVLQLERGRVESGLVAESDPVSKLLEQVIKLTESGLSFEESLDSVAGTVSNVSVRHAFVHIALAHKEGGELAAPLAELSDATQQFYQEKVEEEIAKLPAKATLPLLCIFAGVIICFIVFPFMRLSGVISSVSGS